MIIGFIIGLILVALTVAIAYIIDFFEPNWDSTYDPRSKYKIWRDKRKTRKDCKYGHFSPRVYDKIGYWENETTPVDYDCYVCDHCGEKWIKCLRTYI